MDELAGIVIGIGILVMLWSMIFKATKPAHKGIKSLWNVCMGIVGMLLGVIALGIATIVDSITDGKNGGSGP